MKIAYALVALLMASSVLAGCLATDPDLDTDAGRDILDPALREALSEPIYEILGHFEEKFTGTTETQLYVDYYLPDVPADHKVPVILVFTPYQGANEEDLLGDAAYQLPGADDATYAYWPSLVRDFVPRGYAVAFADVRGNHQAGGCIDQTGPEQWQDGYDYVEWLGTQDWSNGKVGMYGVSYDAETQFTTAMMDPPHLTTIVPVASVSNQYEWNFYQGVPYDLQPFIGMFGYFTGSAAPSYDPTDAAVYPEKLECQQEAFEAGLDFSGDMTTFWRERDYRPMAKQINASVLHVHGLADWNVRPIHIDPLFNDIESEKRGLFGLWHHTLPDRDDWQDILIAWYDHWLLDKQNGILDILPPVLIEDSTGQWHGIDSFPPTEQEWLTLELSVDGKLTSVGNASAGEVIIHDHRTDGPIGYSNPAAAEARAVQESMTGHPDVLSFTFVTEEELRLVGRPEVILNAASNEKSTHWAVRLEVEGDENCAYTHRDRDYTQSVCANTGYQDTRHRHGFDAPSDLVPGETYNVTVQMYPQFDIIPAGKKVTLFVSNNDDQIQQDDTSAMSTLFLGDGNTLLRLPLSPTSIELPHETLPEIYPGYLAEA